MKLRRGVGGQNNLLMDDTGLVRVVVGFAVPLICQPFAASIGGSSDSRTAYAPLDDLNGAVKNCYVVFLLPPQSAVGDIGQQKRNRRKADVSFLLAHKGFGEGTSPSRPQDATAPGRAHDTGTVYKCAVLRTDYSPFPAFCAFSVNSLAPGRRERSIRNALIASPSMLAVTGNTPSMIAPCTIRR